MIISKKRHDLIVEDYEKRVAALELENAELREQGREISLEALREKLLRLDAEQALTTALAATDVALKNADAETVAADAALARYLADYAPRALEPAA